MIREPAADRSNAADLVRRFADAWAHPQVERFVSMLAADVVLTQPVTPTIRGRAAAREEFSRLLAWLPDLAGTVDRWGAEGDTVLIAWRLRFALGRGPYELRIVDRIVHRDGLIAEREAYFDSLRFLLAALGRPSAWLGYLRYRGYVPARARADAEAGQRPADGSARRT